MVTPDQFTEKSALAIQSAAEIAGNKGNSQLEAIHLLEALLQQHDTAVQPLVEASGDSVSTLQEAVSAAIDQLPRLSSTTNSQVRASSDVQRILSSADGFMKELGDSYLSTEHLLWALASVPTTAQDILNRHKVTAASIAAHIKEVRGNMNVTDQHPAKYSDSFT